MFGSDRRVLWKLSRLTGLEFLPSESAQSVSRWFFCEWLEDILSCVREHTSSFHLLHKVFSFHCWEKRELKVSGLKVPDCSLPLRSRISQYEWKSYTGIHLPVWLTLHLLVFSFNAGLLVSLSTGLRWETSHGLKSCHKKRKKNERNDNRGERRKKKTDFCFNLILCPRNTAWVLSPPHLLVAKRPLLPVTVVLV